MPINLPNLITVLRLFAVPVVIWTILAGYLQVAFWVFLAAGTSDAIDGYLARKWNQRTELGAYLDPIADKSLLVSIFITLSIAQLIPVWLAIAVVSRDLMIVGAVILSWLLDHPVTIKPLLISKLNTVVQIGFAALALGLVGFGLHADAWLRFASYLTGVLTVLSALAYLAAWLEHMAEPRSAE